MKNKILIILSLLSIFISGIGCATIPSKPTPQAQYFINCDGPVVMTDAGNYSKTGKSSAKSILGLFAWGDASIQTAMDEGGFKKIHHVDYDQLYIVIPIPKFNVPIYSEFTTVVYGE